MLPATLLILLFGIVDLGWMVFNYSQLYHSLREGGGRRYGSDPPTVRGKPTALGAPL